MKTKLLLSILILSGGLLLAACGTSRAAYETAPYKVIQKDGYIEIREYPSLTLVSTAMDREAGRPERDDRFMKLFGYISGANGAQQKIEMTTPVFMDQGSETSKMSFVVPAKVTADGVPPPTAPGVAVEVRPAMRCIVLRFSGLQSESAESQAFAELRQYLAAHPMNTEGEPGFAYYDPPWTPGPWRRNEVYLRIAAAPPADDPES